MMSRLRGPTNAKVQYSNIGCCLGNSALVMEECASCLERRGRGASVPHINVLFTVSGSHPGKNCGLRLSVVNGQSALGSARIVHGQDEWPLLIWWR